MSVVEKEIGNMDGVNGVSGVDTNKEWELPLRPLYKNGEIVRYTGNVSLGLLSSMYRSGQIYYNPLKQRGSRINKDGSTEPFVIKSKIKEITTKILGNKFFGNLITLNLRKEENPELFFDETTGILHGKNRFELIDGCHRLTSGLFIINKWEKLKEKDKHLIVNPFQYEMIVSVEILSDQDSSALFSEYNSKQTKVNSNVCHFLDVYDLTNTVARRLVDESELRDKIKIGSGSIRAKGNNDLTNFAKIYEGIKNNFRDKILTKSEADKVANYLILFWDELINLLPEYMGHISNRQEMRDKDLTIQQITFNAYFAVARKLYGLENWQERLAKLKEPVQVDGFRGYIFSKDNPYWSECFRIKNGIPMVVNSSSTIRAVTKHVVSYIVPEDNVKE